MGELISLYEKNRVIIASFLLKLWSRMLSKQRPKPTKYYANRFRLSAGSTAIDSTTKC